MPRMRDLKNRLKNINRQAEDNKMLMRALEILSIRIYDLDRSKLPGDVYSSALSEAREALRGKL